MEPTYIMAENITTFVFILWFIIGIGAFAAYECDSMSRKQKIALCIACGPFSWFCLALAGVVEFAGFIAGKKNILFD